MVSEGVVQPRLVEFGTLTTFAISLTLVLQSVSIFNLTLALVHYRDFWQP